MSKDKQESLSEMPNINLFKMAEKLLKNMKNASKNETSKNRSRKLYTNSVNPEIIRRRTLRSRSSAAEAASATSAAEFSPPQLQRSVVSRSVSSTATAPPQSGSSRSITFSENIPSDVSIVNRLGRPLKEGNEIYSLSNKADYRISDLIKGPKPEKIETGPKLHSYNEVQIIDHNVSGDEISRKIYSDKVLKLDDEGRAEIARIVETNKELKVGIVVKKGAFYFIVERIDDPAVGATYKNKKLLLLQFPDLTPELELRKIKGKDEFIPFDVSRTKNANDYDVEIAPIEDLVQLYLNNVFDVINAKKPNVIDKELMMRIEEAAAPYDCREKLENIRNRLKLPLGPVPSGPVPSEPAPSGPAPSEPAPSGPVPSEPAPSEPAPSGPAPSGPAPSEPAPSEPAPSEPAPSGPAGGGGSGPGKSPTIIGALPTGLGIRRMTMSEYKALSNKNIPVIIDSAPNTIHVISGLASEVILDNLNHLGDEEDEWRKLLFIAPNRVFNTIQDVLPEQVCFIIMFSYLFFASVVNDETIQITQSDTFHKKYDVVSRLLEKPFTLAQKAEYGIIWQNLETKYINENKDKRHITFDDFKSLIISGPDHITKYFEESIKMQNGEEVQRSVKKRIASANRHPSISRRGSIAPQMSQFPNNESTA